MEKIVKKVGRRQPLSMMMRLVLVVCPIMAVVLCWVFYNLFRWSIMEGDVDRKSVV